MVSYLSQGCRRSLVRSGAQQGPKRIETNPHPSRLRFKLGVFAESQLLESSLVVSSSSLILLVGFLGLIPLSRCLGLVLVPSAEDLRQPDDIRAGMLARYAETSMGGFNVLEEIEHRFTPGQGLAQP